MGLSGSHNSMETLALRQIAEVEGKLLAQLTEVLQEVAPSPAEIEEHATMMEYVANLCSTLFVDNDFSGKAWGPCVKPYLSCFLPPDEASMACELFRSRTEKQAEQERMANLGLEIEEDMGPEVCNIYFSLAYGGKVLLHNTHLFLHRGKKYGLLGHNGAGKTTLLRNIANGKIEGMPKQLVSVFVESHFDDEAGVTTPVLDVITQDPMLVHTKTPAECEAYLRENLGFDDEKLQGELSALSGGWRMKLALARCALINPDIMLLDEPTNHLDHKTVAWFVDKLQKETHATVLVVSHDTGFLDNVCTDIIHYENQKLVRYPGNLSNFVEKKPECRSYYELASTGGLSFKFPNPGRLEGVANTSRKIAYLQNVDYKYPGAKQNQLTGVSCHLCLASRVCVLGANGAGKTTLIKLLVGETLPSNQDKEVAGVGEVWQHHNLRISYVAQHSFHHVEAHLDKSPVEYIQWRFKNAEDQESLAKDSMKVDEAAADLLGQKYGQIDKLTGSRHTKGGKLEYEVSFVGKREKDNAFISREDLEKLGYGPLCKQIDEKVAAEAAGVDLRNNTTTEVQAHLDDFNLAQEFGTYGRIKGLSGGQKVKLVLAAAFWTVPHLLVLDEPTNYLDREALGALAEAIKKFGGGVIMISHNKEFYGALCSEEWVIDEGKLDVVGEAEDRDLLVTRKKTEKDLLNDANAATEGEKGGGNANDVVMLQNLINEKTGRPLSKKEIRAMAKSSKKK